MANFCVKCGGGLDTGAGFCRQCGSPVSAGQQPVQNAAPVYNNPPPAAPLAPATKSGSALKFLLIAFLIFAVLGVAGVVGVYYYVKGKAVEKMADFKERTGVDVGAALEKAARGKPSSTGKTRERVRHDVDYARRHLRVRRRVGGQRTAAASCRSLRGRRPL